MPLRLLEIVIRQVFYRGIVVVANFRSVFLLTVAFPKLGLSQAGLGPFTFGYPFLLAIPLAMLAVSVLAAVLDRLVYQSWRLKRVKVVVMTMASLGIAIALRAVIQMIWGTQPLQYPQEARQFLFLPGDIRIPPDNLFLASSCPSWDGRS